MQGWKDGAADIENIGKATDNALREKRTVPSGCARNERMCRSRRPNQFCYAQVNPCSPSRELFFAAA